MTLSLQILWKWWLFIVLLFFAGTALSQEQNSVEPPLYIYEDGFVACSPSGTMGSNQGTSLSIVEQSTENPYKGDHCFKLSSNGTEGWSGVFVQKNGAWKRDLDAGADLVDLHNYRYLTFYARAESDYVMGRLGMGEGNNDILQYEGKVPLKSEWQRYVIEPNAKLDRSAVNGLFVAVFEGEGTVYFDEMYYADRFLKIEPTDVVFSERKAPLDSNAIYLYHDQWVNGIPSGYMGEFNGASMKFDWACRDHPFEGPKCIKVQVSKGELWRGIHIQQTGKWGERLTEYDQLLDLSGSGTLVFYARTDEKPLVVPEIGMGAGTYIEERRFLPYVEFTSEWQRFEIDMSDTELSEINTVFYMLLPVGTFYLDEIRYLKAASNPSKIHGFVQE